MSIYYQENCQKLRREFPHTAPRMLKDGPIIGMGYRSPWVIGNKIQAQVAKELDLKVMLAQQSVREIERTKRSFQEVLDSATVASYLAGLKLPWGADADHLKKESEIEEAARAGFTHFTYDVTNELGSGLKRQLADRIHSLYRFTLELKGRDSFTCEVSLDEADEATTPEDLINLLDELRRRKIGVDEIAPRFPGNFEKAIDYYWKMDDNRKVHDTGIFEQYLSEIMKIFKKYGIRVSIHSGSDKFSIYPIISRIAGNDYHLKTAGTYYLEELKVVARHDPDLFKEIYCFSQKQFKRDVSSYKISADFKNIPNLSTFNGNQLAYMLESCAGNDDLRQILHVTYGSVLTATDEYGSRFAVRIFNILKKNEKEYFKILSNHIKRHLKLLNLA